MAAQADTNLAALRWVLEAGDWGLVSTDDGWVAPSFTDLRYTGESLKYDKKVVRSNEIRPDRNISDHIEVGPNDVSGDINGELSFATYDGFFKQLLLPDEAAVANGTDPVAATIAPINLSGNIYSITDTNTIARTSGSFITAGFVVGMKFRMGGWANAANNSIFTLAAVNALTMDVVGTPLVSSGADATAGQAITFKAQMYRNGTGKVLGVAAPLPSLIIEKQFTDLSSVFQHFVGLRVNQLQLNMQASQIVTTVWSMMGKTFLGTNATVGSGAPAAANTNNVLNCTSNVSVIEENGSAINFFIKNLSLTIKNNIRQKDAIGNKFPIEQGLGWFEVEGKFEAYFKDATLYNKIINHTTSSISFRLTDAAGNVYIFTIPKIKFLKGDPLVSGGNADVMLPIEFGAFYDSTSKASMQLDIIPV